MYNFYRWYPTGKVVFLAPTRPLVAQQIEACFNVMGVPQDHTTEMTGKYLDWKYYSYIYYLWIRCKVIICVI